MSELNTETVYNRQRLLVAFANMCEFYEMYVLMHCAFLLQDHWLFGQSATFMDGVKTFGLTLLPAAGLIFLWAPRGDKFGRKHVLIACSITVMLTTLATAVLPDYDVLGEWAMRLFIGLRVAQAIAMAGEPIAAKIYAVENNFTANYEKIWWIQIMTNGQACGAMLAIITAIVSISLQDTFDWAWRIPFIFAIIPSFCAILLRWKLIETEEYGKILGYKHPHKLLNSFYKKHQVRNWLSFVLTGLYISFCIQYLYRYVAPETFKFNNLGQKDVLIFNLQNLICSYIILTGIAWIISKYEWNVQKSQFVMFLISLVGLFMLRNTPLDNIFMMRVGIITVEVGGVWCILYASIISVLPMKYRFRYMGNGYATSKLILFVLFTFALTPILNHYGLEGLNNLAFVMWGLSVLGLFLHYGPMAQGSKWHKAYWDFRQASIKDGSYLPIGHPDHRTYED